MHAFPRVRSMNTVARCYPLRSTLLILLLLVTLLAHRGSSASGAQAIPSWTERPDYRALLARVEATGPTRVIVGLDVPFQPEGRLPNPRAVQAQRDAIARAQTALLNKASLRAVRGVKRFKYIPFIALQADAATLAALAADPDVTSVAEDQVRVLHLQQSVPLIGADVAWN